MLGRRYGWQVGGNCGLVTYDCEGEQIGACVRRAIPPAYDTLGNKKVEGSQAGYGRFAVVFSRQAITVSVGPTYRATKNRTPRACTLSCPKLSTTATSAAASHYPSVQRVDGGDIDGGASERSRDGVPMRGSLMGSSYGERLFSLATSRFGLYDLLRVQKPPSPVLLSISGRPLHSTSL